MDQRRIMLAVLLSLGVVLAYNELVVRQYPQHPPARAGAPSTTIPDEPTKAGRAPQTVAPAGTDYLSFDPGHERPVVVETDLFRADVATVGGRLRTFALKDFRRTVDPESPLLDLVAHENVLPLTLQLGADASDAAVRYEPSARTVRATGAERAELVLTGTTPSGLQVEKRLRFPGNSYLFDVEIRIVGDQGMPADVSLVFPRLGHDALPGDGSSVQEVAVALATGKLAETYIQELLKEPNSNATAIPDATWVAFSVPYFVAALVTPGPRQDTAYVETAGSIPVIRLEQALADGAANFRVFVGPKAREVLAEAGFDLSRTLDFGWFWFVAVPMLYALRMLHGVTGNYGVDIILLTALVRVATIPLTQKSFRSMREMQKLQPQMKRLQERYKDDKAKLQQETMELYKSHGVNPLSGCGPMVLQIPIFVGLYNTLLHAIELRHAPFGLWITDLSAPERLVVAGVGIPVLTILMGVTMLLQQKLTPQQGDPAQQRIMMIMPLVFTFMLINFPSGLVLYWLVSNILGIGQQYFVLKAVK